MKSYKLIELLFTEEDEPVLSEGYTTTKGKIVEYGSQDHVDDIGNAIQALDLIRKQMPRKKQRKERFTISRCIESLRYMQKSAKKTGIKKGIIELIED